MNLFLASGVCCAYLASLGLDITWGDVTNRGRIDLTVGIRDNMYILEFKVNGSGNVLAQEKKLPAEISGWKKDHFQICMSGYEQPEVI